MMQSIAGGTAIYTHCPIERAFRDVHAATQHFSIQPSMYEPIGRVLLDLPAGDALPL
jgi:indole-3-acetate monooxygenase